MVRQVGARRPPDRGEAGTGASGRRSSDHCAVPGLVVNIRCRSRIASSVRGAPHPPGPHRYDDPPSRCTITGRGLRTVTPRPDPLLKRAADLLVSAAGLILAVPLWPLAAVAVMLEDGLEDGRPVLVRQERVGRGGRVFTVYRFRSLRVDADVRPGHGPPPANAVTRVGRVLRSTAVDELPQLWNVPRGQMSLVGPRPLLLEQVAPRREDAPDLHEEPGFYRRHRVRPGLTGVAQLLADGRVTFRQKFRYDVFYVRRRSLRLDLVLLLRSLGRTLRGKW